MNKSYLRFRLKILFLSILPLLLVPFLAYFFGEVNIDSKFISIWLRLSVVFILFTNFVCSPKFKKVEDLERPIREKLKKIPEYKKFGLYTRIVAAIFLILVFILLALKERSLAGILIMIGFILGSWGAKQNLRYARLLREAKKTEAYRIATNEAVKDTVKRALIATPILIILVIILIFSF